MRVGAHDSGTRKQDRLGDALRAVLNNSAPRVGMQGNATAGTREYAKEDSTTLPLQAHTRQVLTSDTRTEVYTSKEKSSLTVPVRRRGSEKNRSPQKIRVIVVDITKRQSRLKILDYRETKRRRGRKSPTQDTKHQVVRGWYKRGTVISPLLR